jgi:hypothetical protein
VRTSLSTEFASEYYCSGDRSDCTSGERSGFNFPNTHGRWHSDALFADVEYGASRSLTVGVSTSIADARFTDDLAVRKTTGFGDTYARARVGFTSWPIATGAALVVKAPTGQAPVDTSLIPLSEGQWDAEVDVSVGRSFWPRDAYAFAETGYRYRTRSHRVEPSIEVGDELPFLIEAGGMLHHTFGLRVRALGFWGGSGSQDFGGVRYRVPARRVFALAPSAVWRFGRSGEAELTFSTILAGQDYPALSAVRLGIALSRSLRETPPSTP